MAIIYFFVEGIEDEHFLKSIIKPKLPLDTTIRIVKYRNIAATTIFTEIDITNNENTCIFLGDLDFDEEKQCIEHRIKNLKIKYKIPNNCKVFISINEIESWYISGFTSGFCRINEHKIEYIEDSQFVTRETFKKLYKKNGYSLLSYLKREIDKFDINHAKTRNKSFEIFCNAIGI